MNQDRQTIALDVHAHLVPVDEPALGRIRGVSWDSASRAMLVDGHSVAMAPLFDPAALLAWMDRHAVQQAWISAPPPLYRQHLAGSAARDWCHYLNSGLQAIATASGGRLKALLHLPTQDPALAAELVAQAREAGHSLFAMPTGTADGRTLADPAFEPLWSELDRSGAFVFLHPGECADGRLRAFYMSNLLGNPYESGVALASLAFAGVPARYPRMIMCLAHGGGVAPMVAGRWQRGHATARPGIDPAAPDPASQLRHIHVDCICHHEASGALAEDVFGEQQVVFGSDWPFPMGLTDPHAQLQDFNPARRDRYFRANPGVLLDRLARRQAEARGG